VDSAVQSPRRQARSSTELAEKLRLTFPLTYSADADEVASEDRR